jgi:hypothetical protein
MTMKQFHTAARRGEGAVNNPVDIIFEWEVRDGEFVEMTAHAPTTGQLALFFAHQTDIGTGGIRALFDLLASVLGDADYKIIENQLYDGLDVAVVIEVVQYLTEQWSARPTKKPASSPGSRRNGGKRSTVKPLTAVSTTSNSDSTDS